MSILPILIFPHPILKQKARLITEFDAGVHKQTDDMLDTMYHEKLVGIGANMVGIENSIIVLDLNPNEKNPYVMINPKVLEYSDETSIIQEASPSLPGISANITRPVAIKVEYLDREGKKQVLEADDMLARVIQHEIDYLEGIVFIDHLSKLKRDLLLTKMKKYAKLHPPHVHTEDCRH